MIPAQTQPMRSIDPKHMHVCLEQRLACVLASDSRQHRHQMVTLSTACCVARCLASSTLSHLCFRGRGSRMSETAEGNPWKPMCVLCFASSHLTQHQRVSGTLISCVNFAMNMQQQSVFCSLFTHSHTVKTVCSAHYRVRRPIHASAHQCMCAVMRQGAGPTVLNLDHLSVLNHLSWSLLL